MRVWLCFVGDSVDLFLFNLLFMLSFNVYLIVFSLRYFFPLLDIESQNSSVPWLGELRKCYMACFTTSTPNLKSNSYIGVCKTLEEIMHVEPTAGEMLWSQLCDALLDNVAKDRTGQNHTLAMLQVLRIDLADSFIPSHPQFGCTTRKFCMHAVHEILPLN